MYLIPAVIFLLVLAALIDIITKQDGQVKHLPKMVWILLVIVLPLIGSIIWFAVGREYSTPVSRGTFGDPRRREADAAHGSVYRRGTGDGAGSGGSTGGGSRAGRKLTTEEELAELEREIEYHKKQARIVQLQAELDERNGRTD